MREAETASPEEEGRHREREHKEAAGKEAECLLALVGGGCESGQGLSLKGTGYSGLLPQWGH